MKRTTPILLTILLLSIAAVVFYYVVLKKKDSRSVASTSGQIKTRKKEPRPASETSAPEFVSAAREVTAGVVHIKSLSSASTGVDEEGYLPYGQRQAPSVASGSGVIISEDGYIATNNHVIENASEIMVILTDRREYAAELVGRDPNTDLALLKIKATSLPVVALGNSDEVEVGEW